MAEANSGKKGLERWHTECLGVQIWAPETTKAHLKWAFAGTVACRPLHRVLQVTAVNVQKLYPGAPVCVPKISQNFVVGAAFLPVGEAVSDHPKGWLGRYAGSSDCFSPKKEVKTAKGPDRSEAQKTADLRGRSESRAVRYELLSMARELLISEGKKEGLVYPSDFHKTAKCMHTPHGQVSVLRDKARGNAFFGGLVTCGSTWACPVCTTKVQERRRQEIAHAFDWAYNTAGLQPVMVTLTFPHKTWDDLENLVLQQRQALKLLRYGMPWRKLVEATGYQGLIRALEITRGAHGWHPHTHEVWFVGKHVKARDLKKEVLKQWLSACIRAGLVDAAKAKEVAAFMKRAVHVKGWCKDSDYLAKAADDKNWGVDREIAKGATKVGKLKGLHPFQLLAKAAEGDIHAGKLFVEFVWTMRKTLSRPLFWSPGLKARAGLKDRTDEQLATEQREEADVLGLLARGDWERVRLFRKRAQLLDAAETGGWPAVLALLAQLLKAADSSLRPVRLFVPEVRIRLLEEVIAMDDREVNNVLKFPGRRYRGLSYYPLYDRPTKKA